MLKAVLADDEKKVIFLLRELIDWEKMGYEIVGVANDGLRALELVSQKKPHLLITDIRMPGCSGIDLIRQAKELQPSLHCIIISGYQEFEYARSALKYGVEDYLLKPLKKDELCEILLRLRVKLGEEETMASRMKLSEENRQERFLADLRSAAMRGLPFSGAAGVNDQYGFHFPCLPRSEGDPAAAPVYYAAVIRVDLMGAPDFENRPEQRRVLLQHALEITRRHSSGIAQEACAAVVPEGIAAVFGGESYDSVEMRQCFTRIRREIEQQRDLFGNIRASVYAGSRQDTMEALPLSLREALWLCADRICANEKAADLTAGAVPHADIRDAAAESIDEDLHYRMEIARRQKLQESVGMLDEEGFAENLEESRDELRKMRPLCGCMVREWYTEIVRICMYSLSQNSLTQEEGGNLFMEEELLDRFWECPDIRTASALLKVTFGDRIRRAREEKAQKESRPIMLAKHYIQTHSEEQIRLEDVSEYVGFNATYFSTLFKKETGQGFSDYLAGVRIERARALLVDESLSVMDVCEKVGYKDLKYFSRLFKKITGVSPSDYRRLYR